MIYRPCDGEYELIYDSHEHPCIEKHDNLLRQYFVEHLVLKELQSCGFKFKWKNYPKEYTFDGITFGRQVPWYWSYGVYDLDIDKLRLGLGLVTHQLFLNNKQHACYCLIHGQDYQNFVTKKTEDFISFFVIQEEDLSLYAIGNK